MDLRYAFRMLAKTPGFTLVSILTLALGIALNTVVFTFYESVVWKPLPVRAPAEIVRVYGHQNGEELDQFSYSEYTQLRDANRSFASMLATSLPQSVLSVLPGGKPESAELVHARFVSANYFPALGVNAVLGRTLQDDPSGVVVSHAFWEARLLGDSSILGRTMAIQGTAFTILGIAPESFAGTGLPPQAPDVWLPLSAQPLVLPNVDWLSDPAARQWQILARRKPDVSVKSASAELDTLAAGWPLLDGKRTSLSAKPAAFFQPDSGEFEVFTVITQVLMVAVGLILLIGCVNVVNLLIARGVAREREFAVRKALGAGRLQLIRQLCTESLLLGVLGGALGLVLSMWSADWIRVSIFGILQRISGELAVSLNVSPDWRIFGYSAALSVLTGILVGVWPAVRASRTDINGVLKQEGAMDSRRGFWTSRNILLTSQVASCLILLAGAGVLFRGAWRSQDVDTQFDSKHVFWLGVSTHMLASTNVAQTALIREVAARVADLPEVVAVAQADHAPFLGHGSGPFENAEHQRVACLFNAVSDRYFETLGIPVLAGRAFTPAETENGESVAIVSESAAHAFWPGKDPLGQRVSAGGWLIGERGPLSSKVFTYTVVGVVKSVRSTYLSKLDSPFIYFPKAIFPGSPLLVRARIAPEAVMKRTIARLAEIRPNLPSASTLLTLEQGPVQIQRLFAEGPAMASSILGLVALLSAAIGIFGMVSYLVALRTREIGIRIALGAHRRDVIRMVMTQGLRAVAWGAGIGLIGALGLATLLSSLMRFPDVPDYTYGAGAFNMTTFLGVLTVLCAVVLIASFVPVRRATRVEPAVALRNG
jgi:putative ABC transport system permease protein